MKQLQVPSFLVQFGAGIALLYSVQKFFKLIEDGLNPKLKTLISNWLLNAKPDDEALISWPNSFTELFEHVFGKQHLSKRCFFASSVASCLAVVIASVLVRLLFEDPAIFGKSYPRFIGAAIAVNIIPDYLGLWETRKALWVLKTYQYRFAVLVTDFILKGAFAIAWLRLSLTSRIYDFFFPHHDVGTSGGLIVIQIIAVVEFSNACFLALFFSSIWLWLYGAAGFILRVISRVQPGVRVMTRILDVEGHPLNSIGLVSGAIVALVYWTFVAFSGIIQKSVAG